MTYFGCAVETRVAGVPYIPNLGEGSSLVLRGNKVKYFDYWAGDWVLVPDGLLEIEGDEVDPYRLDQESASIVAYEKKVVFLKRMNDGKKAKKEERERKQAAIDKAIAEEKSAVDAYVHSWLEAIAFVEQREKHEAANAAYAKREEKRKKAQQYNNNINTTVTYHRARQHAHHKAKTH